MEVDRQIEKQRKQDQQSVVARIRALMAEHGLAIADLGQKASKRVAMPLAEGRPAVRPKYRDPASGRTWSGRGLMPVWLRNATDAGKSKDDFLIDKAGME